MNRVVVLTIKVLLWVTAVVVPCFVGMLLFFLLDKGLPVISLKLLFGDVAPVKALLLRERVFDGIFPAMAGTFLVVLLSVMWAIPMGVLSGIYVAEFAGGTVKKILDISFDVLASVPSIVIGLFGLTLAIFLHKNISHRIYPCLLISSAALAILILPYIVRTTELSIESVSLPLRLAGLSLGATKQRNLLSVILPRCSGGILSGVILATARAAEDTAVIMLTGVVASAGIPHSLFSRFEALPFYIYYISSQYADQYELKKGFGAAIVLLIITGMLFGFAHLLKKLVARKINGFD